MEEFPHVNENEVSFRDYVLKARTYVAEVLRFWYIPAFFILLFVGYQVYKYSIYVPLYPATITFSVDEDEAGGQSALTGMLSQFGLGSVRPARYNFDKILELSRSRRVVQESLFAKITIDGKEDFLEGIISNLTIHRIICFCIDVKLCKIGKYFTQRYFPFIAADVQNDRATIKRYTV